MPKETKEPTIIDNSAQQYVLNTNTMKFHYPHCESVSQMAEHNKVIETTTREDLINRGFSSCGNCKP